MVFGFAEITHEGFGFGLSRSLSLSEPPPPPPPEQQPSPPPHAWSMFATGMRPLPSTDFSREKGVNWKIAIALIKTPMMKNTVQYFFNVFLNTFIIRFVIIINYLITFRCAVSAGVGPADTAESLVRAEILP